MQGKLVKWDKFPSVAVQTVDDFATWSTTA